MLRLRVLKGISIQYFELNRANFKREMVLRKTGSRILSSFFVYYEELLEDVVASSITSRRLQSPFGCSYCLLTMMTSQKALKSFSRVSRI